MGIAVANTLEKLGVKDVGLKWPNDVFVGGRKVAGILLELSGEATTSWSVVCGIGLNVLMTEKEGETIGQEWVSLSAFVECSRNVVAAELFNQLIEVMEEFKCGSFSDFIARWEHYDILRGKEVVVLPGTTTGRVVGVNAQGALLVSNGEEYIVTAGEVSVRRL